MATTYLPTYEPLLWLRDELPQLLSAAGTVTTFGYRGDYLLFDLSLKQRMRVLAPRSTGCIKVNPDTLAIFSGTYLGFELRNSLEAKQKLEMRVNYMATWSQAEGQRLAACKQNGKWLIKNYQLKGEEITFVRATDHELRTRIRGFANEIATKSSWCYVTEPSQ